MFVKPLAVAGVLTAPPGRHGLETGRSTEDRPQHRGQNLTIGTCMFIKQTMREICAGCLFAGFVCYAAWWWSWPWWVYSAGSGPPSFSNASINGSFTWCIRSAANKMSVSAIPACAAHWRNSRACSSLCSIQCGISTRIFLIRSYSTPKINYPRQFCCSMVRKFCRSASFITPCLTATNCPPADWAAAARLLTM